MTKSIPIAYRIGREVKFYFLTKTKKKHSQPRQWWRREYSSEVEAEQAKWDYMLKGEV